MAASTCYNQNPSSSASPPATMWDVFLSFRGVDTRNSFTSHLYKDLCRNGIKTFKDDPELLPGEVIPRALPQAIQDSKIYIVVFSENYASSSWCLDELVEILRCHKTIKRLVVPVFYYIDPYVVRHQVESFKDAFDKHQTRYDVEKVNNWRLTLKEVADFSGYHISKNRSQAAIVDEVVERVLLEINPVTLNVAKYPVGLDSRVKEVTALFNSDLEPVIKIGIHGMGGVGKTTLAKAVYNQNYQRFQGSCFLANVREVSGMRNGPVSLQKQLIADVLKRNNINVGNVDQGIELIRARICSRKVLIVIDDLDDPKPLEYLQGSFALGSVVIITTRNEDLLDKIEVKAKYKVNQMDRWESHHLFIQHAFGEDKIPHTFTELSKEILRHAGGLPLALQVFGSTLLNESEDGWKWFIDKLKRAPIDDVEENLMISFDALKSVDPNLQDIFLDIACFYIGWKKEEVAKILETCYTFVNRKVDILQKRCLITISENDNLGMHDLLRDMGRKIARNNSPNEPGKHSRLWVLKDIDIVLKNHKGTEAIQGIISGYSSYKFRMNGATFVAKSFKRMSKLKFLYLNNVNLTGSFKQTFKDLRWLHWTFFPLESLPSEFYGKKLVTLELPHSKIRTMWELNMASQVFTKLKTLNMSGSQKLQVPDFTRFPCLETLNLEDCSSLEEVHVSIGSLASLVHLNLRNCKNLRILPHSIFSLRALEVLNISGCTILEALPTKLGSIESLKTLNASGLNVSKLPDSIGNLVRLVSLNLMNCSSLRSLPDSICSLRALEVLTVTGCSTLEALPTELGNIESLKELNAGKLNVSKLPDSIGRLSNLVNLDISDNKKLETLPDSTRNLRSLKILDIRGCKKLAELPHQLEMITSLRKLNLKYDTMLRVLPDISQLSHIKHLDLKGFRHLLCISGLPTILEWIDAEDCTSLKKLPDLSSLKHLTKLDLTNCVALKEIQGLEDCTSLECLCLLNCRSLERLPNLCNLKHLESLKLTHCDSLKEIIGLEELTSLGGLKFAYCGNLLSVSKLPPNLKWLEAQGCTSLKKLPNLSNLKQLERVDLTSCEALKEIEGLEEVTSLEFLTLSNCRCMERFSNLSNLKHLKILDLANCKALKEIQGLEEVTSLEFLTLSNCRCIERLRNLSNLKHLKRLDLTNCEALKEIQGLEEVTSLGFLTLSNCRSMEILPNLANLKHLKRLDLEYCAILTEVLGLEDLTSLENLQFRCCGNLLSVSKLPPNLKWVDAEGCTSLKRLPNLSNLKQLEELDLTNCSGLTEIQGLEQLTCLRELHLAGCNSSFLAHIHKAFF